MTEESNAELEAGPGINNSLPGVPGYIAGLVIYPWQEGEASPQGPCPSFLPCSTKRKQ